MKHEKGSVVRMRKFKRLWPLALHGTTSGHPAARYRKRAVGKMAGLSCSLLAGVVFGSIFPYMAGSNRYLSYFAQQYLVGNHNGSFSSVASGSFFSAMVMQATVLFFSLSCIGVPLLLCIPFLRGITIGCISAYLYTEMGSRGLVANMILLWIPEVLQAACLLFFVSAALQTSIDLFRSCFLAQTSGSAAPKIGRCIRCFIFSSLGLLLASLIEGLLAAVFAPVLLNLSA